MEVIGHEALNHHRRRPAMFPISLELIANALLFLSTLVG